MKVMVISHSYVVDINQQKVQRLAEMPGISVALAAPEKWRDMGRDIPLHRPPAPDFRLYPLRVFWHNHLYAYFFDWLQLFRAFLRERPDVVYLEEEPQSLSAFQAILLAKLFRAKIILLTWENLKVKFTCYKRLLAWWNIRNLDAAVGGTGEALETLRKLGFSRAGYINPQFGLDEKQFRRFHPSALREKMGLDKRFVIGFIARMTAEKGILTLVRAAAALDFNFTVLAVGEGPAKKEAMELAGQLGVQKKILWPGIIKHDQLAEYMNCFDVFVLPSIPGPGWKEQFGHVVIEAMACQVPVIGSDCGAIPELTGDGGLIFRAGEDSQLARHLQTLHGDPDLREQLGLRGRKRVLENYSDGVIVRKLYGIIREVCSEAAGKRR